MRSLPSIPEEPAAGSRAARLPIATALRATLAGGYRAADLKADLLAGIVVGIVALPLSMALAIAVGVAPQHGLYTAIVAGAVTAVLGGSRFQVTGPTAAFIVILAPIVDKHGLGGLLTAGFIAGLMLIAMGAAKMGRFIQFIPHPVTTGFTTGIGAVIATLQLKDILGLSVAHPGESYLQKVAAFWHARGTLRGTEIAMAALTFGLLLLVPRVQRRVPAPLIALGVAALVGIGVHAVEPSLRFDTLGTRFTSEIGGQIVHGIPRSLPLPSLPWQAAGLSFADVEELIGAAFAIAMLGAIESLLSSVIADSLTGTRHDPDAELVGLGVANVLTPFFGGIAATGALARTATNVRSGAKSPFAAVIHALFVLVSILALAPLVAYVPMASLAALLLLVAWNMSEVHTFVNIFKIAPKSDISVMVTCFTLTVLFDMVIAIAVGVVLAAILFMRRMAELTGARAMISESDAHEQGLVPPGVALYEIQGPLFFGAAKAAMGAMTAITDEHPRAVVIDLGQVPMMDATGLVALDTAIGTLMREKIGVVLAGPLPRPERIFQKAKLTQKYPQLQVAPGLREALAVAAKLEPPPPSRRGTTPPPPP